MNYINKYLKYYTKNMNGGDIIFILLKVYCFIIVKIN